MQGNNDIYKKMVINRLGKMYNVCKDVKKIIYRMSFEHHPITGYMECYIKRFHNDVERKRKYVTRDGFHTYDLEDFKIHYFHGLRSNRDLARRFLRRYSYCHICRSCCRYKKN